MYMSLSRLLSQFGSRSFQNTELCLSIGEMNFFTKAQRRNVCILMIRYFEFTYINVAHSQIICYSFNMCEYRSVHVKLLLDQVKQTDFFKALNETELSL